MQQFAIGLQTEIDRVKPEQWYVTNGERGILYVGGGKYWAGIVTGIRLLRRYGCNLPVEIWYRGDVEYVEPEDVKKLGDVTLHNIDYYSRQLRDNRISSKRVESGGWEAKTYAMTHTALSQVLYLDADAYCVDDPTAAFDMLIAKPFVYWQDLGNHAADVKWDHIYPKGKGFEPLIQGGQLFIDRGKGIRYLFL